MIAKKNSRVDLERKRTALFAMGLLTAGSFTLAAFTYEGSSTVELAKEGVTPTRIDYVVQKEKKEVVKDEQVKIETEQSNNDQSSATMDERSTPDESSKTTDNTTKEFDAEVGLKNLPYTYGDDMPDIDILEEEIVEWVDTEAQFAGGYKAMMKYITENVEYPEAAIDGGDQGRVYLNFIVEKDGSITHISVEKGVCRSLDREAKRIVKSFPKWIPAEFEARKVRTRVRLPIVFLLD